MPTFEYQLASGSSRGGTGVVEAPDRAAAIRRLRDRGEAPTMLVEVAGTGSTNEPRASTAPGAAGARAATSGGGFGLRRVMSRAEMGAFIRELATAVSAGLPLVQALRTIMRQGRNPAQKAMLEKLIDGVEHGQALSDSMRAFGRPFGDLVINLVHAGEVSGRLGEVLMQAARLLDRDVKLRRSLTGALLYPAIILTAVSVAVVIVVTIIVPRVLAAVEGQVVNLPMPTRVVQGVASFFGSYWWLVLLAIGGAVWGAARLYARPGPRLSIDRATLRLPVVGAMVRDVAVARFTRTFGTLVGAGLPVLQSLRITRATLGNRAMEGAIEQVCDRLAAGETISEPMERSGYFPPLLVQIVGLGERTGRLDEMLTQAADAFEDKTEQSIKLFTSVLPPLLIVVLACVVGFVVLSVLLPLIELQEMVK